MLCLFALLSQFHVRLHHLSHNLLLDVDLDGIFTSDAGDYSHFWLSSLSILGFVLSRLVKNQPPVSSVSLRTNAFCLPSVRWGRWVVRVVVQRCTHMLGLVSELDSMAHPHVSLFTFCWTVLDSVWQAEWTNRKCLNVTDAWWQHPSVTVDVQLSRYMTF